MKTSLFLFAVFFILTKSFAQNYKKDAGIIINSPKLSEIVSSTVQVEILGEGFEWTEGPLWLEKENKLIFSDIPNNSIFEWTENGGVKLYLKPAGYTGKAERGGETGSNGLLLNPEGELVLCQHGDRRMAKMNAPLSNPKSNFKTLADNFNGKKTEQPERCSFS